MSGLANYIYNIILRVIDFSPYFYGVSLFRHLINKNSNYKLLINTIYHMYKDYSLIWKFLTFVRYQNIIKTTVEEQCANLIILENNRFYQVPNLLLGCINDHKSLIIESIIFDCMWANMVP